MRQLNGQLVEFTNSKDLQKFLMSSEDAAFMWSDSEDLAVISDMFQLRIKIITSKGPLEKIQQSIGFIQMLI